MSAVLPPVLAKDALLCTEGTSVYQALAKTAGIEHHVLITSRGIRIKAKKGFSLSIMSMPMTVV